MKMWVLTFAFYVVLALIAFGNLPHTFFQQDEWAIIGNYMYWLKAHLGWFSRLFVYEQDTHLIPLGNIFSYIQFRFFGLFFWPYGIVSIVLHVLNSTLVAILAKKFFNSNRVAWLAGAFFLINATTHQAISWTATTAGTAGSAFFVLISLIYFYRHLESKKTLSWHLIMSLGFFLISLGFKETSIFLFVFYPIFWLMAGRKRVVRNGVIFAVLLALVGFAYLGARVVISQFWTATSSTAVELSQPSISVYIYRLVSNPIRIFAQTLLPVPILLKVARQIVVLGYPQFVSGLTPDPYIVESVASDIVSFVFAAITALTFLFFYQRVLRNRMRTDVPLLFASIAFIITSALPFLIIPGKAGYISLFDGRHLYLTSVFVAIVLAVLVVRTHEVLPRRRFVVIAIALLTMGFLSLHAIKIRRDIDYQVAMGQLRRSILNTVTSAYPTLPQKAVLYIESDKAYFGLPPEETIVPFQSGFGQTLLVWYNARGENFPACFFEHKFLYVLTSQDYKECEGRGFGYFRKSTTLNQAIRTHVIDANEILAFRFTSSTNLLQDVTVEIREKIRRFGQL